MAASTDFISFPPDFDLKGFAQKNSRICVVAVIGKSRFAPYYSKASFLNPVVDRDIFQGFESVVGGGLTKNDMECYYDEDNQVLYLHLMSHQDTSRLVQQCRQAAKHKNRDDFYSQWQKAEFRYARMLLLAFSLSHIVLLNHPTATFDMTYIKFFRILDQVRLKLQPRLSEMLKELPVSKQWADTGRLCSPRVLFLFHYHTVGPNIDDDSCISKSRSQKLPPLKRMQRNLEDQIYHVLRRARVITNISNNSLFAVPANQEYVFVKSSRNEATEPNTFLLNFMRNNFQGNDLSCWACPGYADCDHGSQKTDGRVHARGETSRSKSSHSRRGNNANVTGSSSIETTRPPLVSVRQENSFKEFLWQHIEIAFSKGFDDNVGRNPVPARFELPTTSLWLDVCHRMYKFLFDTTSEGRVQTALHLMQNLLDPDMRFSEGRCKKIIAMAEAAYQSELPPFYVTAYHMSKLAQARRVYSQYARGPAFNKYLRQLEESCTAFWTCGHQQCEAVSLSGNLCINQLHRALTEAVTEENRDLPIMAHLSQRKTKAACNCGRQQAEKDDPFDHRSANYDFYLTLEAGCCGTLQHIDMPAFKPSMGLGTAVTTPTPSPSGKVPVEEVTKDEGAEVKDIIGGMSALSLALSLGQSMGGSDPFHHDQADLAEDEEALVEEEEEEEEEDMQHEAGLSQGVMMPPLRPPSLTDAQDEGNEEGEEGATELEGDTEGDEEEANKEEADKEANKDEADKEEVDKEEAGKEANKDEAYKEEAGKDDADKEEVDKEEADKEEVDKEEVDKEEVDKEVAGEEGTSKEVVNKEEVNKEEANKEEANKEEVNKEEANKEEEGDRKEEGSKETDKEEGEKKEEKAEAQAEIQQERVTEDGNSGHRKESTASVQSILEEASGDQQDSKKMPVTAVRQHSTTEYLPGMLHSNSPPGLLPKFPSWSLCCLDSAEFYNHQHGLDLPGFLIGSNFLLPWDLSLHGDKERWPTINETTSKRGRHSRRAAQKSVSEPGENTVRVFIGMEYECPRGHRFFCSGPDKVIKVLGNCSVKDTASRLVSTDMPLYTTCHCHTPKGFLGQLMRVYVVTPEGPQRVILHPKLRPGPPPCPIFHPGCGEIELPPGGIWVLRLPHVYMGDNGPIAVPSDPQNLHACIALKGFFSFKELTSDG